MEDSRITQPTKVYSYGLTETEAARKGLSRFCTMFSVYIFWLLAWWFCGNSKWDQLCM